MPERPTWSLPQQIIAYMIVSATIGNIFLWTLRPPKDLDPSVLTVITLVLGALLTKFGTVVDFCFGSSQGSKNKDEAQASVVQQLTTAALAPAVSAAAAVTAAAEAAAPAAAKIEAPPAAKDAAPAAAREAVAEVMKDKS